MASYIHTIVADSFATAVGFGWRRFFGLVVTSIGKVYGSMFSKNEHAGQITAQVLLSCLCYCLRYCYDHRVTMRSEGYQATKHVHGIMQRDDGLRRRALPLAAHMSKSARRP